MRTPSTLVTTVTLIATITLAVAAFSLMAVLPADAQAKPKSAAPKMAGPDIMLMQPTALKAGDNQFEVMVKARTASR